jgi:hypothetical protein
MLDQDRDQTAYDLAELPDRSTLRSVTAVPADIAVRRALRVELTLFVDIGSESFFSNLKITRR